MKIKKIIMFFVLSCLVLVFSCNHPPDNPICVYPLDGATNITDSVIILQWTAYDEDGDDLYFDVYFNVDTIGRSILDENIISKGLKETSITVSNLKDSTTYFWLIKSQDGTGDFNALGCTFTTGIIKK